MVNISATTTHWLRLRVVVGYLGEKAQFGWWPTCFYEPSSRAFIEPTFSRTAALVQYNGVCVAARDLHNARVGVGNAFHLYLLPPETEQELHNSALFGDGRDALAAPTDADSAIAVLASIAGRPKEARTLVAEGPSLVGKWEAPLAPDVLPRIAQEYLGAFQAGGQVFPYIAA